MAKLIDGKKIAGEIRARIAQETASFTAENGYAPGLSVIIVGEDPASQVYVRNKKRACEEVGFASEVIALPAETTEAELVSRIARLADDPRVHGILVQLPLPAHIREGAVIAAIPPQKDVDAFHPENVGRIMTGHFDLLPCTPAGVMELLRHEGIDPEGKECVVVGRSNIVGKPMAMLLLHAHGTVTLCHSHTRDLAAHTRRADILVAAVGRVRLIRGDMVRDGAVVIDVGMNRDENGKLCGDVDFDTVEPKASAITPVPGGVGPMTIAMLLKNTLTAARLAAARERS